MAVTDEQGHVRALDWEEGEARMQRLLRLHYGRDAVLLVSGTMPAPLRSALEAYFSGDLTAIDAVTTVTGGTPFQRSVWAALRKIPAGQALSYSELAGRIGKPLAVRAVGLANGSNPIALVVPCHRVVGADRSLTGFASGLHRKEWLLSHEGVQDVHSAVRAPAAKKRRVTLAGSGAAMLTLAA